MVYPYIKKSIETPLLSPESCLDMQTKQSVYLLNTCYNQSANNLAVTLTKTDETPLSSIIFKLDFDNETLNWQCDSNCVGCKILDQGDKTYHLFPDRIPQRVTVLANDCDIGAKEVSSC